jgi:hypothetical protein
VVVGSSSECWSFFYYYYFLRARATLILHTGTGGEKSVLSPLWFRQSVVEGRGAFDQKRQHDPPMVFLIQVLTLFALAFFTSSPTFQSLLPLAYSVRLLFCFNLSLAVDPAILFSLFFSVIFVIRVCFLTQFLHSRDTRRVGGNRKKEAIFSVSPSQFSARLTGGNNGSLVQAETFPSASSFYYIVLCVCVLSLVSSLPLCSLH